MGIPLRYVAKIGGYILKQHLTGRKRYPLVMMMEPLFRCNLACAGCGKIDYPDEILNKRLPVDEALESVRECGAPVVVIAGGEPLLHKDLPQIVEGIIAQKKFAIVCTNALLLEKKIAQYKPSPYFTWSIHLDGDKEMHDQSVCQRGVYDKAVAAIQKAKEMGFRVTINCTFFNNSSADKIADFFDSVTRMGIDGITVSPGYAYERAPDQQHFLNRRATKDLFRGVFRLGKEKGREKWTFQQSGLFLDFLAGNQTYHCTPWGNPTRTVFGWQKPCYLLGEGYAKTFKELMETTDWDSYGTGNYEKCADCMVHSGYEASSVVDSVKKPWKPVIYALRGIKTEGEMAPRSPSRTSARPSSCSHATSRRSSPRSGTPRPTPRSARQRPNAAKAADESRARRTSPPTLADRRARADRTARRSGSPSGLRALAIAAGRARSAGSHTTRTAQNGSPCASAKAAATWDSMSTAAAPVSSRSRALACGDSTAASTPTTSASTTRTGASASRRARAATTCGCAGCRTPPALTPVATTTSPGTRSGSSPPAMPMLITARQPGAARARNRSRSRSGLPPAPTVATPGPAASRASRARPVTASTGWGPRGPVVSSTTVMRGSGNAVGRGVRFSHTRAGEASVWRW